MREGSIRIRNARQNNLAGVDLEIPRGKLVAVTGVSGSGKSSLAFDTLFREGQRRFLETLSAYARQFLGHMQRPDVESIEGLSPAIAVDQKALSRGARSTVGTLTEITDHLRVLFARAGRPHCPHCGLAIRSQTPEAICQHVLRDYAGQPVHVLAPLVRARKGHHRALFEDLQRKGFVRVRVDGEVQRIEEVPELARYKQHTIEVVIDRLRVDPDQVSRVRDAVEQAVQMGDGDLIVLAKDGELSLSTQRTCPGCSRDVPPLEPRLFSFNSPHGACPRCDGMGALREPTESAVVRDAGLSIRQGALAVTRASGGALLFPRCDFSFLEAIGEAHGFDLDTPWRDLDAAARRKILEGTGDERFRDKASWKGARFQGQVEWNRRYRGVLPALRRALSRGSRRKMVQRFMSEVTCPECEGTRINEAARAVLFGGVDFRTFGATPISDLLALLDGCALEKREERIARDLLSEVRRRVEFLLRVGLGYLSLDRAADTLSGGEAQRIRLAAQLGAGLQGVLYVLDEPSIGLHARDHGRLLDALRHLRDLGNSVIVVEHDEATLRAADWLVDVGPAAGRHGGHIVASGPPETVADADSPTGRLLRGELELERPSERRAGNGKVLAVRGARAFNLKDVDVELPLGTLTAITGVSGSGKSTLVDRILRRALERHLGREAPEPAAHERIEGLEHVDELVSVDASPIGRTPRSNPATYTGVLGPVRDLFAALPEAQMRGYTKSRFSFNVAGGRCEACGGAGANYVELQFLAPVTVECEECGGRRFNAETLAVRYHGHSIADVLAMTIEDASVLFQDHPKIARPLAMLVEVGLGYLTLGQPSTTLSGGEAQRIKLAKELSKRPRNHTLYLLDEPTTGLHQEDVGRLVAALQRLVSLGHSVVVIEHNLDFIAAADHVVDLGPEGGAAGGEVLAAGTPEEVEAEERSHTGRALIEHHAARPTRKSRARRAKRQPAEATRKEPVGVTPPDRLEVVGARTHNLCHVDVSIPRDALTVVTGPSGSGKSSLALDTIYTEGRRRFVESLSTYARQFLGTKDRPPVDRIEGLGPSVAVEARVGGSQPRSTVATTTEIHDHLRVLWSRAGVPRCPDHGDVLEKTSPSQVARRVSRDLEGEKGWVLAPIFGGSADPPADFLGAVREGVRSWRAAGFARALVDGKEVRLETSEVLGLEPLEEDEEPPVIDLVVDRLVFGAESRARVAEAVEQAEAISDGRVRVRTRGGAERDYSTRGACPTCGFVLRDTLEPRHFSFNAHVGACPACDGLGRRARCDEELLISRPEASLLDGAIPGKLGRYLTKGKGYYEHLLRTVARKHRVDLAKPYADLSDAHRALLAYGEGARERYEVRMERHTENVDVDERFTADWPGLCGQIDAWHARTDDPEWAALLESVMTRRSCSECEGERLAPSSRAVTLAGKRLPEVLRVSVEEALAWLDKARIPAAQREAVEPVLAELRARLELLARVGLGYLTLDRATSTLSGGEARRVRLSASLGSQLVGVCYVLDEPTVGLHPRDVSSLTDTLLELVERGNTVIVVEHDAGLMKRAHWLVDIGPGAGIGGGRVVASGTPEEVTGNAESLTGQALRGELALRKVLAPTTERATPGNRVVLRGARTNNLRGVDFGFRFGELTGVCGPSGSGKSTLVLDTLVPALDGEDPDGRWRGLTGAAGGGLRVVVVDASPVGRTPASIPATYTGLMDPLRELFCRTPDARMRGFGPANFSFNSTRGRCPACEGRGATKVEMQFLADLWLVCEECDGQRYRPEVLEVRFRGRSIADVLALTIEEASELLEHQPKAARVLATLRDVGLGYLRLDQSSTTLSGGEAQRLKLAAELQRAEGGERAVVILDEPTTGLHASDLVHLARVLRRLTDAGNAVIVIEHHTELLAVCDQLVELGPEGGAEGGRVIAKGTPEELARDPASVTGPWLELDRAGPGKRRRRKKEEVKT